jgi:hypothetical protein
LWAILDIVLITDDNITSSMVVLLFVENDFGEVGETEAHDEIGSDAVSFASVTSIFICFSSNQLLWVFVFDGSQIPKLSVTIPAICVLFPEN